MGTNLTVGVPRSMYKYYQSFDLIEFQNFGFCKEETLQVLNEYSSTILALQNYRLLGWARLRNKYLNTEPANSIGVAMIALNPDNEKILATIENDTVRVLDRLQLDEIFKTI